MFDLDSCPWVGARVAYVYTCAPHTVPQNIYLSENHNCTCHLLVWVIPSIALVPKAVWRSLPRCQYEQAIPLMSEQLTPQSWEVQFNVHTQCSARRLPRSLHGVNSKSIMEFSTAGHYIPWIREITWWPEILQGLNWLSSSERILMWTFLVESF